MAHDLQGETIAQLTEYLPELETLSSNSRRVRTPVLQMEEFLQDSRWCDNGNTDYFKRAEERTSASSRWCKIRLRSHRLQLWRKHGEAARCAGVENTMSRQDEGERRVERVTTSAGRRSSYKRVQPRKGQVWWLVIHVLVFLSGKLQSCWKTSCQSSNVIT